MGSGIANEKELEEIKEKAIKDIHQEVNKNIVVPLDEILSQMRKAESHESGKDLAKGQGEVS
ncbi:MAG: hypothetical protein LUQ44_02845 [Methanothrix sp.]|nr:hypothetical protein [Methanothrix sp.]